MIFDIAQDCHTPTISRPTINDLNTSSLAQIAQLVASTSQLFNIIDVTQWSQEHPDVPIDDELKQTQAVLCMPIINAQKSVIGVVQFINKVCFTLYLPPFLHSPLLSPNRAIENLFDYVSDKRISLLFNSVCSFFFSPSFSRFVLLFW